MATQQLNQWGLNPKEERFCQEYLLDLNGTQSALRAGYGKHTGSSEVLADRLLGKVRVQNRIAVLQADRCARLRLKTV
jgi:phage terminase small subunit